MKIDDMVLRDGRKLIDVWPDAGDEVRPHDAIEFVSFPEGQRGKLFIEYGNGEDRTISLYVFRANGESDFVESMGVEADIAAHGAERIAPVDYESIGPAEWS